MVWIARSSCFIRFTLFSNFSTLLPKFSNLSSYSFGENSLFSFRSFTSLLRLSRRWFVDQLFSVIKSRMDCSCLWNISWYFWTTAVLCCSFSIFPKMRLMSSIVKFLDDISISVEFHNKVSRFMSCSSARKISPSLTTFDRRVWIA